MDDAVRQLIDRQAITDVIHEYCRDVDLYRPAAIAALFTDDCLVDYGPTLGSATGAPEVERTLAAGLARYRATSHHVSNIHLAFDGPDRAVGVTYVYAWHRMRDARPDAHLWAQYHDVFVRRGGGWRIAERRLKVAGQEAFDIEWAPIGRERAPADRNEVPAGDGGGAR